MSSVLGLIMLDETVVGVALPMIQEEFGMSAVLSGWVVNSYLLVFSCLVALAGRLGDTIGLKVVSITGLGIFGVASLISGLAPDGTWLITARAIQGIGCSSEFSDLVGDHHNCFSPRRTGSCPGYLRVGGRNVSRVWATLQWPPQRVCFLAVDLLDQPAARRFGCESSLGVECAPASNRVGTGGIQGGPFCVIIDISPWLVRYRVRYHARAGMGVVHSSFHDTPSQRGLAPCELRVH